LYHPVCVICGLCCNQAVVFLQYFGMFVFFVGCYAVAKVKGQHRSVNSKPVK